VRRAAVADEKELRVRLELPQRQRKLHARDDRRAQARFHAVGRDERRYPVDGRHAVDRVHRERRAADVVAMEILPRGPEELRLAPRAEHTGITKSRSM
jgi:hypothetical protein